MPLRGKNRGVTICLSRPVSNIYGVERHKSKVLGGYCIGKHLDAKSLWLLFGAVYFFM